MHILYVWARLSYNMKIIITHVYVKILSDLTDWSEKKNGYNNLIILME